MSAKRGAKQRCGTACLHAQASGMTHAQTERKRVVAQLEKELAVTSAALQAEQQRRHAGEAAARAQVRQSVPRAWPLPRAWPVQRSLRLPPARQGSGRCADGAKSAAGGARAAGTVGAAAGRGAARDVWTGMCPLLTRAQLQAQVATLQARLEHARAQPLGDGAAEERDERARLRAENAALQRQVSEAQQQLRARDSAAAAAGEAGAAAERDERARLLAAAEAHGAEEEERWRRRVRRAVAAERARAHAQHEAMREAAAQEWTRERRALGEQVRKFKAAAALAEVCVCVCARAAAAASGPPVHALAPPLTAPVAVQYQLQVLSATGGATAEARGKATRKSLADSEDVAELQARVRVRCERGSERLRQR